MIDLTTIDVNPIPKPTMLLMETNRSLGSKNINLKITLGLIILVGFIILPIIIRKNDKYEENK
jgi:hypothetical protein